MKFVHSTYRHLAVRRIQGNVVPGCSLGVSHALSPMSRTKYPKQGISGVRNLLAGEVVPFQMDVQMSFVKRPID